MFLRSVVTLDAVGRANRLAPGQVEYPAGCHRGHPGNMASDPYQQRLHLSGHRPAPHLSHSHRIVDGNLPKCCDLIRAAPCASSPASHQNRKSETPRAELVHSERMLAPRDSRF